MTLVSTIRDELAAAGDPERAVEQQRYMKSALPFHGVPMPEVRRMARTAVEGWATRNDWESDVRTLWDAATHREERYAATALTGHRAARIWQDPSTLELYRHLVVTGAWWDHVDEVASRRVGPILRSHPADVTPVMRSWAVDEDLWVRRTAIICQLGSKEDTDVELLRDCIEPNLDDTDFFVRKAIGWSLRQLARTDPEWVLAFVDEHRERLSGLSRREALKHLSCA